MESLPRQFLEEIARKYNLSEEQESVFIELFSSNCSQQEIADNLHISKSALTTRMSGVYQKFNYKQKTPNKARQLHDFLVKKHKKAIFESNLDNSSEDIKTLVNQFRNRVKSDIQNRCGTMRILDMTQPIGLSDIYTQVNILEKIIGRRRKEIAELFQDCNLEDFDRFGLGRVTEEKIPAKQAVSKYRKLLILGKPGAGKTTFLKHLAIQCDRNEFQGDLVPFFVTLKDFAEAEDKPGLLAYLDPPKSPLTRETSSDRDDLEQIFNNGKALILLDGLDEVLEEDSDRVLKEIRDFSLDFPNNQYVMTCRIAAKEYTFEKFTEVEIADFDWEQIQIFANNWFKNKAIKSETFLERLEKDEPIQELASNPLLLTLICLAFEESGEFPANRAGLYKEGLDALLKKWDAKRGITRDEVYQKLWVQRKEDLLSKIAWDTFAPGEYFFKQEKVERCIGEYIRNLPGTSNDEETLRLDSEVVLKSIESQHGLLVERAKNIYSFSHLSFQEYFTAREVVIICQSSEAGLHELVSHLFEKRWREVFLLAVAMSPNADLLVLLMKETIDKLIAENEKIQDLLHWLNIKTKAVDIKFKTKDIWNLRIFNYFFINQNISLSRVVYFDICLFNSLNIFLEFSICRPLFCRFVPPISIDLELSRILDMAKDFNQYNPWIELSFGEIIDLIKKGDRKLYEELQKLNNIILARRNSKELNQWWKANSKLWREDLRKITIEYRNIGHDWQFSEEQKELLKQYYFANQLLTQCLHQECYVSREVRQEIEETLLLPISEIEKRKLGQS
jgi:predicted NACHT family NTPase